MASMGLFAAVAWNSRSRLGGLTTGSGASYLSGIGSAVTGKAENSQRFLGTCAAPLLRFCPNHGWRDARKTLVPNEIARNSELLAGLGSLCQTFSEVDWALRVR